MKSASRVQVFSLQADGTYYTETAEVGDKFILGKRSKILRTLNRDAVFPKADPIKFASIDELLQAETPNPALRARKRRILTVHNDPHPTLFDESTIHADIRKEAQVLNQTWRNERMHEASADSDRERTMTMVFIMVAGAICLLVALFAIIAAGFMWL